MLRGDRSTREPEASVRYFGDNQCRSIWQRQSILAFTAVTIAAGVAFFTPELFDDWRFSAGLLMIVVITAISLGIPWHRVPQSAVLVVPVLDAVAIGLLQSGVNPILAFLWVFPVAWVGTHFSTAALIGLLVLVNLSLHFRMLSVGISPQEAINVAILMITLGFVGIMTMGSARRSRANQRLLRGQSSRIAYALRRVTEQKARNRRVLDSLDIGVARVDENGMIETANRVFHALYAIEESGTSRPTSAVEYRARRGEPVPQNETTIARASRGELFNDSVVWLFGLDGQWRALNASTRLLEAGAGDDGILLIVEDVTAKVDPRADKKETRRTISHELRNPLTAIIGHIDLLLERDDVSEGARRQIEVVERAGERMERLISSALSTASDPSEDADVDFDLAEIARASVEGFAPVAEAAEVALKVELDEPLPRHGDAFRLRQVVDNVIGNAVKYAQRGGTVLVRAARHEDGVDEAALIVSDTGIGISAEDLPHIFEPEFRAQLARERGIPGTGLGLGISRDIVIDQGGRLDITSELGKGTEVALVLPSPSERRAA